MSIEHTIFIVNKSIHPTITIFYPTSTTCASTIYIHFWQFISCQGFHICQHQLIHFNILLLRLEYSDSCNSNNTCNHRNFHFFVFHCSIV
mgnify:CR=1 FL=1